jgi:hypothetical protein
MSDTGGSSSSGLSSRSRRSRMAPSAARASGRSRTRSATSSGSRRRQRSHPTSLSSPLRSMLRTSRRDTWSTNAPSCARSSRRRLGPGWRAALPSTGLGASQPRTSYVSACFVRCLTPGRLLKYLHKKMEAAIRLTAQPLRKALNHAPLASECAESAAMLRPVDPGPRGSSAHACALRTGGCSLQGSMESTAA